MRVYFKKLFILFLVFGFASGLTASINSFDRQLKGITFEIEKEMGSDIELKLQKVLGNQNFWLNLNLSFDKEKLKRDFINLQNEYQRKSNPKRSGQKYSDLPGLSLTRGGVPVIKDDSQKIVIISDGPELTRSFVLSYVTDVFVEVAIDKENERKAQSALRKLLEEYFKELSVPVKLKFNRRKIAGLVPEVTNTENEAADSGVKTEIKINTKSMAQDFGKYFAPSILDQLEGRYLKPAIIVLSIFSFLSLVFVSFVFMSFRKSSKNNIEQFNKMIKEMSNALMSLSFGQDVSYDENSNQIADGDSLEKSGDTDFGIMAQIKGLLEKSPQLTCYLLKFFVNNKQYENCYLLLQSIGLDYLVWLKKEVGDKAFQEFVIDIRENGTIYSNEEARLKNLKAMYHKIWQASLNLSNLYLEELRQKLSKFQKDEALTLMGQSTQEEAAIILDMLSDQTIANLIKEGKLSSEAVGRINPPSMSKNQLVAILDRINAMMGGVTGQEFTLEKVGHLLPLEDEIKLLSAAGMPSGFHLADLAKEFKDDFIQEAVSLSLDDLAAFLGIATRDMKEDIMAHLPEIKARRLEQRTLEVTDRGIKLKSLITKKLRKKLSPEKWSQYRQFLWERQEDKKQAQIRKMGTDELSKKRNAA